MALIDEKYGKKNPEVIDGMKIVPYRDFSQETIRDIKNAERAFQKGFISVFFGYYEGCDMGDIVKTIGRTIVLLGFFIYGIESGVYWACIPLPLILSLALYLTKGGNQAARSWNKTLDYLLDDIKKMEEVEKLENKKLREEDRIRVAQEIMKSTGMNSKSEDEVKNLVEHAQLHGLDSINEKTKIKPIEDVDYEIDKKKIDDKIAVVDDELTLLYKERDRVFNLTTLKNEKV